MTRALILATIGLLVSAAAGQVWPPKPEEPKGHDYVKWFQTRVQADASSDENAYPVLHEILGELASTPLDVPSAMPWDPNAAPNRLSVYEWVHDHLDTIEKGAGKTYYWPPDKGPLVPDMPLTDYQKLVARLLIAAWHAPEGTVDVKHFQKCMELAVQLSGQLCRVPRVEAQLSADSVQALVNQQLQAAAAHEVLHGDDLKQALQLVEKMPQARPFAATTLAGELAGKYAFIQAVQNSKTKQFPQSLETLAQILKSDTVDVKRTVNTIHTYLVEVSKTATEPYTLAKLSKLDELHKKADVNAVTTSLTDDYGPAFAQAGFAIAQRRATAIILDLFITGQHRVGAPKSLDDLDVKLSRKWTTDPFIGKPFHYTVENGEPVLYSVGLDGKDDGGRNVTIMQQLSHKPVTGDLVFWPPPLGAQPEPGGRPSDPRQESDDPVRSAGSLAPGNNKAAAGCDRGVIENRLPA